MYYFSRDWYTAGLWLNLSECSVVIDGRLQLLLMCCFSLQATITVDAVLYKSYCEALGPYNTAEKAPISHRGIKRGQITSRSCSYGG